MKGLQALQHLRVLIRRFEPVSSKCLYERHDGRLLVHRHIDFSYEEVGIQVPAGSIREGETPEAAALRELKEETGQGCFEIVASLGTSTYDMSPYREEIQERHFFLAKPTGELPERWLSEEDHDGTQPSTKLECFWIPLSHAHILSAGQGVMLGEIEKVFS